MSIAWWIQLVVFGKKIGYDYFYRFGFLAHSAHHIFKSGEQIGQNYRWVFDKQETHRDHVGNNLAGGLERNNIEYWEKAKLIKFCAFRTMITRHYLWPTSLINYKKVLAQNVRNYSTGSFGEKRVRIRKESSIIDVLAFSVDQVSNARNQVGGNNNWKHPTSRPRCHLKYSKGIWRIIFNETSGFPFLQGKTNRPSMQKDPTCTDLSRYSNSIFSRSTGICTACKWWHFWKF